ncbi:MAG: hypothetical protein AAF514_05080 [Verrucomicrobiota bacterium]
MTATIMAIGALTLPQANAQNEDDPFLAHPKVAVDANQPKSTPTDSNPFADGDRAESLPSPPMVGVLFEMVQTDLLTANRLVSEYLSEPTADQLRSAIDGLIEAGEAELLQSSYLRTLSGQRTKTHSVTERIRFNETDPPELAQSVKLKIDGNRPSEDLIENLLGNLKTSPHPTALDTDFLGLMVEIDATVGPTGDWIDVNMNPTHTFHEGDDPFYGAHSESTGQNLTIPRVRTLTSNLALTTRSGQHQMIGLWNPDPAKDDRIMAFVRADLLSIKPGPRKKPDDPANIGARLELIEVGKDQANALMRLHAEALDNSSLRKNLFELIHRGDAKLLDTIYSLSRSGQTLESLSTSGHMAATEFDPAEIMQKTEFEVTGPSKPGMENLFRNAIKTGPHPQALQKRDLGIVLRGDPVLSAANDLIQITFASSWDRLLRMVTLSDLEQNPIVVPVYHSMTTNTSLICRPGETQLVGLWNPDSATEEQIFVLLRLDVLN